MEHGTSLRAGLNTAGERLVIECEVPRLSSLVRECADGTLHEPEPQDAATLEIRVEASRVAFETEGWALLTRDSWRDGGRVVVRDVCTAGLDAFVSKDSGVPRFTFRRRPPARTRAAAALLPSRARLLTRAALLQYPPLWWAAAHHGRAPMHAPALSAEGSTMLLVGTSGVGKTTLILRETAAGGLATGDNVTVGDGVSVWGLVEPVRAEGGSGRSMPHGRRETHLAGRVERLEPDRVMVLRRGARRRARAMDPQEAAREITASTYMAGELRRFWTLAAVLALGTRVGPAHPPVAEVARAFTERLPCVEVELPSVRGIRAADLLEASEVRAWT